jgi:hypothetical protein
MKYFTVHLIVGSILAVALYFGYTTYIEPEIVELTTAIESIGR